MSKNPPSPPRPTIAPEFTGLGRLASVLKPRGDRRTGSGSGTSDAEVWTVFGVGAIWQTAAENAARRANMDLADWLDQTIRSAAAVEGFAMPPENAGR